MVDKVLSWNDFNGRLTMKSGHTANLCPSYGDVKSCNSSSVYTSVIRWPVGREDTRLILNSLFNPFSYILEFMNINEDIAGIELQKDIKTTISVRALKHTAEFNLPVNLHCTIIINELIIDNIPGNSLDHNKMEFYEEEHDINPEIHKFTIIPKVHNFSGSIEIWIDEHEETKKTLNFVEPYVNDI